MAKRGAREREKEWGPSLIGPDSIWDIRVTAGDEIRVKEAGGAWIGVLLGVIVAEVLERRGGAVVRLEKWISLYTIKDKPHLIYVFFCSLLQ